MMANRLSIDDCNDLINNVPLNERHIDAAQALLHSQFPQVRGFCVTSLPLVAEPFEFPYQSENRVVQLHQVQKSHWVVSCAQPRDAFITVYNSALHFDKDNKVVLPLDLEMQLCQLYKSSDMLSVVLPEVQQETNIALSGLFAIAWAFELCSGGLPEHCQLLKDRLNFHLLKCFKNHTMFAFPHITFNRIIPYYTQTVPLFCHLGGKGQTYQKRIICCQVCTKWYTERCCSDHFKDKHYWKCPSCVRVVLVKEDMFTGRKSDSGKISPWTDGSQKDETQKTSKDESSCQSNIWKQAFRESLVEHVRNVDKSIDLNFQENFRKKEKERDFFGETSTQFHLNARKLAFHESLFEHVRNVDKISNLDAKGLQKNEADKYFQTQESFPTTDKNVYNLIQMAKEQFRNIELVESSSQILLSEDLGQNPIQIAPERPIAMENIPKNVEEPPQIDAEEKIENKPQKEEEIKPKGNIFIAGESVIGLDSKSAVEKEEKEIQEPLKAEQEKNDETSSLGSGDASRQNPPEEEPQEIEKIEPVANPTQ